MHPILQAYDEQLRRHPPGDGTVRIERDGDVVRAVGDGQRGWCGVLWSSLDESNADAAIARQVDFFAGIGRRFEWKYHDYDTPADLEQRLLDAGFERSEDESIVIAEAGDIPNFEPPEGCRLERVTDASGIDAMLSVNDAVFGPHEPQYRRSLESFVERGDGTNVLVLAVVDGEPVSAARLELHRGREFASLWGGGTLERYRGRGIYRALVSYRAGIARSAGYRFLHVDASCDSRPILERIGFKPYARTTPFERRPQQS